METMTSPRKVILNMLKARKYLIENEEEFISSTEEVILVNKIGNEDDRIYVFFPRTNAKTGVSTIRQYIKEMQDNDVKRGIIVVKDDVTAFAKQVFIQEKSLIIECFKEDELLIDILDHVLVPKHELITENEKTELLKIYKLKETQLPKILSSDPVSRYFGAKKGEVFKIIRSSESSGECIYYRIVV